MTTDIRPTHFVFRKTPESWHPYLKLARVDRPIGTWLLLLPCWWSLALADRQPFSTHSRLWFYVILFALGAVLMRGAGCVVNDLWDRKLDAAVARTRVRPLPAGELSARQALLFLGALLLASLCILLCFNAYTVALGVLSLALVASYPLMKRITWWPQLFLGFTFNWGALMGWAAMTGTLHPPALLMYAGGVFWTLAYDTVYAHQDKEDDALAGIKSTARLFGDRSRPVIAAFFALAIAFFVAAKLMTTGISLAPALFLPALLHAAWQLYAWRMDDPQSSLDIFRSNRVFGLLVLLAFAL